MTDSMKSGAGSDPFADDSDDEEESPETSDVTIQETKSQDNSEPESETTGDSSSAHSVTSESADHTAEEDLPYIFGRNTVKTDRQMVQYFLRDETLTLESDVKHAVEQELGTDVYLTDIREALIRVGANHVDELADELRGWGYRYRED
ncbi:hypothetical protein [Halovenus salina]|uniref:Uncharacterized protein n=1 Tax=Halovenus salina TaxID=1510225 RepID=A0ABD5W0V9_9EURY|nr:hypothetical protein [Halovenus salina]